MRHLHLQNRELGFDVARWNAKWRAKPMWHAGMGRTAPGGLVLPSAILLLSLVASPQAPSPGVPPRSSDGEAIESALNDYLYGLRDGDVERLRRAFHPSAEIEGIRDGVFTSWPVREYVAGIVPGQRRPFVPRILSVDHTGAAAVGKVESDYGTWKFVDYLQLLKTDGEWKIVNKIYQRVALDVVR